MMERFGIVVLAMTALTGAAQPEDGFRPTPDEQKRFELMSRPEAWFLESASNDDGEDAFLWARAHAKSLGSETRSGSVGGDSAGGHISLNISLRQIKAKRPTPAYQLLYYTSSDFSTNDESYRLFAEGYGLDTTFRTFMVKNVFPGDLLQKSTKELNGSNFVGKKSRANPMHPPKSNRNGKRH